MEEIIYPQPPDVPLTPIINDNTPPPSNIAPASANLPKDEKENTFLVSLKKPDVTMPKRSGVQKVSLLRSRINLQTPMIFI
uniref:Uncharacterized protein n=1 Tax=Rhizophagus irregularis (strain DAOM 181602 / DAOM 197198 / MUCL 43194) TaxID=747089 RepID=U9UVQ2_RHIID